MSTAAGDLTIKIPKLRHGSFFPSLLTPRRRVDVALHAMVMQAWIEGVSTRKVDDLVAALGVESGISKSEVSRICAQLDVEVAAWRTQRTRGPLRHRGSGARTATRKVLDVLDPTSPAAEPRTCPTGCGSTSGPARLVG